MFKKEKNERSVSNNNKYCNGPPGNIMMVESCALLIQTGKNCCNIMQTYYYESVSFLEFNKFSYLVVTWEVPNMINFGTKLKLKSIYIDTKLWSELVEAAGTPTVKHLRHHLHPNLSQPAMMRRMLKAKLEREEGSVNQEQLSFTRTNQRDWEYRLL